MISRAFLHAATFVAVVLAAAPAARASGPHPQRIVSINLCADELLLALADPAQIVSLSVYATDPRMAYLADRAAAFRHDADDAETVIGLDPDLVLAGRYTKRATRELLTGLGYRVELLDASRSIEDSIDQIRRVARLIGHPERGEALVAEIEGARDRAAATSGIAGGDIRAAVYQRRGYVTGGETLTGDLLAAVGLANAGADLVGDRGGFVRLEELIAEPPDVLVVSAPTVTPADQGEALLAHAALAALFPAEGRIVLPERLTVCGGPSLPEALDWLAAEAKRVRNAP